MELIKRVAPPALNTQEEREAWALAVQIFMQMPPSLNVIRGAHDHFHGWVNEWITTGQRPDLNEAEEFFQPPERPSAEILPFRRIKDAARAASMLAAGVAALAATHVLITQNATVIEGAISLLDTIS